MRDFFCTAYFRFWPKADMDHCTAHVRFRCDFAGLDAIRSNTLRDLDDGPQREVVGAALPEGKKEGPQCHVSATRWVMSALPPKANMCTALAHVCFGLNCGH
jgi:hypothetical protein